MKTVVIFGLILSYLLTFLGLLEGLPRIVDTLGLRLDSGFVFAGSFILPLALVSLPAILLVEKQLKGNSSSADDRQYPEVNEEGGTGLPPGESGAD